MAIKKNHDTSSKTWFITFTCFNWIPLFKITDSYDLVYDWLKIIKEKYFIETIAFVIMPNHVHLILHLNNSDNLNKIISNGKRFMAYEITKRLKSQNQNDILSILSKACSEVEKSKGQLHKTFEPSFDAKEIIYNNFLLQKLNYIHNNPVAGKWQLAETFLDYEHSSVCFYEKGLPHQKIELKHYMDLME
mgnify:FL=1